MRRIVIFMTTFMLLSFPAGAVSEVAALLDRIGGEGTSSRMELIVDSDLAEGGNDVFEIGVKGSKPCIKGNSKSALTAGVGWYLNHYVHVNISWNNLTTDLSSVHFPLPKETSRRVCSAKHRYYMNYCTFSYSTAFWTKERWEKEIDWMALHGINMPLMLVGTDVVWKNTLSQAGYTQEDIGKFIAGPGFQAWWLMNNLEGWGGPNPDWWYRRQEELCKFILDRMRSLGMEPVLPGYAGMIPSNASEKLGVKCVDIGLWLSFQRPSFHLPTDEKYEELAQIYYRNQEKLMGKSKYYSMDPFHEGGSTKGIDLKNAYNTIYSQMQKHSPGSKWVIQSWGKNPRAEVLDTVPKGDLIVLDLFSEGTPRWYGGYQGHDFLWCMLHNFGGKTGIQGRLDATLDGYQEALGMFPANMKGVGATMEGIETNPILYDALFEAPWMKEGERQTWIESWTEARYGRKDPNMESVWKILAPSILAGPPNQQSDVEAVICARPQLEVKRVSGWGTSRLYYDVRKVRQAAALMLKSKESLAGNINYRHDVTDLVRQTITDSTYYLLKDIAECHAKSDMSGFRSGYKRYLEMMQDLDRLLSQTELFTLERWIRSARNVCDEIPGTTESDRDWMEWNARTLVSVWGPEEAANRGKLHDYSHRQWGGMIRDYYMPRWERFFKAMESGETISPEEWFRMEEEWSRSNFLPEYEKENPEDVAEELFEKYFISKSGRVDVIPYPTEVTFAEGRFGLSGVKVYCDKSFDGRSQKVVAEFASRLGTRAVRLKGVSSSGLSFVFDASLPQEGYNIDVAPHGAIVKASTRKGVFYAVQTLKQMLPSEVYGDAPVTEDWTLPCVCIKDSPEFAYRGMMLDVSRHFFDVQTIKRYIDMMAVYKMNRFHWHLTDDQGWRIEIKKYPLLTKVGAWRTGTMVGKDFDSNDGVPHGGFYTQEQIREIVQYADERCITVIPEIDLPGHMLAALTSYPSLGCTGGPYAVWHKWGVSSQVINPVRHETLTFLKDVLSEVADLFPSEYIHIGGDECPVDEWEKNAECQEFIAAMGFVDDKTSSAERKIQYWLTEQLDAFLASKGKKMIGWQEVLGSRLSPDSAIMSWTSRVKGIAAAKAGIDVVMCPSYACYFDYSQSADLSSEPLGISKDARRIVTVPKCYALDPYENIPEDKRHHVLGAQANLWTEYISTPSHLEYMLLPRLAALSEVCWMKHLQKDLDRLKKSLEKHFRIYDVMGYDYRGKLDF